jgi:autotransporter-associated beta strand protein
MIGVGIRRICLLVGSSSVPRLAAVLVLTLCGALLTAAPAAAQTLYIWDGGGGDGRWMTAANWQGDVTPTPAADAILAFDGTPESTLNDFPAGSLFNQLIFTPAGNWTVDGNAIELGISVSTFGAAGTVTINVPIAFNTNATLLATTNTLELAGQISGTGDIEIRGAGTVIYGGTTSNTLIGTTFVESGTLLLDKSGGAVAIAGPLDVGNNNLPGDGTLRLASDANIGDAVSVTVQSGSLLDLDGHVDTIGALVGAGNVSLGSGSLTAGGGNASSLFSGQLSGSGTFIKSGTGTLTLDTANSFDGAMSVTGGTMIVQDAGALGSTAGNTTVNAGGTLELNGAMTVAEPFVLNGGRLRLATGGTIVNGPIQLTATGNFLGAPDTSASCTINGVITGDFTLTKQGAGTVVLTNTANAFGSFFRPFYISTGVVQLGAAGVLADSVFLSISAGATLDLAGFDDTIDSITGAGTLALGAGTLSLTGNTVTTFTGVITGTGGGIIVDNPGAALTLGGAASNTFTGTATVRRGTLSLDKTGGAQAVGGGLVAGGGAGGASGTLIVQRANQVPDTARVYLADAGVFWVNGGDETIGQLRGVAGGRVRLYSNANVPRTLTVDETAGDGAYDGVIQDGGFGGGLTKTGSGALTLSGTNPFSGPTSIQAGALIVNGTHANSPVTVSGTGVLGGSGRVGAVTAQSGGWVSPGPGPSASFGILHTGSLIIGDVVSGVRGQFGAPVAGTGYDQIAVTGTVTLNTAGSAWDFSQLSSVRGDVLTLIDNDGTDPIVGIFGNVPEGRTFTIGARQIRCSYVGGDGNDFVFADVTPLPPVVVEPTVLASMTAGTPFTTAFTAAGGLGAPFTFSITSGQLPDGLVLDGATGVASGTPASAGPFAFTVTAEDAGSHAGSRAYSGEVANAQPTALTYYLSEGATGTFFDEDVLIANPNGAEAPVTLTFYRTDGTTIVASRTVGARARLTLHVDEIPGLEAAEASVKVQSDLGLPLAVERSMFWDATGYAGHASAAVPAPAQDWLFAEGAQGFFDTFVLVVNPNAAPATVTLSFLREGEAPFVTTLPVGALSRLTVPASAFAELRSRSFGIALHASLPVIAERSIYFATTAERLWRGGDASSGVTEASTAWTLAEGATGAFFDTFVLLSNPQPSEAHATLQFLLTSGETVTVPKTIPANGRVTVNVEQEEDPRLANASMATVVTSDVAIVVERSMYWSSDVAPWSEAHNSFGTPGLATHWTLAEGRAGGARHFHSYVLLANPQSTAALATVTYLTEGGAPVVQTVEVPPTSRVSLDVNDIAALRDASFGIDVQVTNGVPIAVERSMYWNANNTFWSGGSNAPATRMPSPR